MKKLCFLLILALLLTLSASAFAEGSMQVDDLALEGCENVTVYGEAGSEAERFAAAAGFDFVDSNAGEAPAGQMEAPVVLPFVKK